MPSTRILPFVTRRARAATAAVWFALSLLPSLPALIAAQTSDTRSADELRPIAITHATVVDVTSGRLRSGQTIVVSGDLIR